MNQAMKKARKELPKLGCEVIYETPHRIAFRLRGGRDWVCTSRTQMHTVRSVIERQRGIHRIETGEYLSAFPEVQGAPRLEVGNYHAPPHFRERASLMRGQGLRNDEITGALLDPDVVRVNPASKRWIYCAGRIGVVVEPAVHGVYTLVTVLWATDDLWEQNPRPEREKL